ncbi:MAG: sodium/solute symporter, partial [Bacteroidota bacterium]
MDSFSITRVDLAIILGYLAIVFFIGLIISRRGRQSEDLFLAGRSLGWVAIGFSLFASNISGSTLIGLSGQAYSAGVSVSNYEWMATIILVILALLFLPFFVQTKISTIPEFLELRYNRFSRKYFSLVTIFLNIVVDTAGSLYGGALVLNVFFPEFDIWQICAALALIAGIYTSIGGLGAVVYTDILQAIVILMGSSILLFAVLGQFGFSWDAAAEMAAAHRMSLILPADDPNLPWTGTLLGLPILGFYYWALNQQIAQRVLGARDITQARWGALLGGFLKL